MKDLRVSTSMLYYITCISVPSFTNNSFRPVVDRNKNKLHQTFLNLRGFHQLSVCWLMFVNAAQVSFGGPFGPLYFRCTDELWRSFQASLFPVHRWALEVLLGLFISDSQVSFVGLLGPLYFRSKCYLKSSTLPLPCSDCDLHNSFLLSITDLRLAFTGDPVFRGFDAGRVANAIWQHIHQPSIVPTDGGGSLRHVC